MIDNAVAALADYAVRTGLIEETDRVWAVNRLLDALGKKTFEAPETVEARPLEAILGELLDYARRQGLTAGPVFCTRNGKGMSRTQVTEEIQTLCHDARVEEEKGTPRCLRKLYLATQAEVERGVRLLAEQSYERMLDTEQLAAGWAEGTGHSIHKDVYI